MDSPFSSPRRWALRTHDRALLLRTLLGFALIGGAPSLAAQETSTLRVIVADAEKGSAVAGAEISVLSSGRRARTDDHGEARLTGIRSGTYEVRVRRLGFAAAALLVPLERDSASITVMLRPAATALDTVHVIESPVIAEEHRQFELRRGRGLGRFMGPEDLAKVNMLEFPVVAMQRFPGLAIITGRAGQWQLASRHGTCGVDTTYEVMNAAGAALRNAPGANAITGAGSGARQTAAEAATSQSSCFSDHPCHVKLFLDDQPVAESDINIVRTDQLYGVEYYAIGNA